MALERGRVWIDHDNLILRAGLHSCLVEAGWGVAGQSDALVPFPDGSFDVLLFPGDRAKAPNFLQHPWPSDVHLVAILQRPSTWDCRWNDRVAGTVSLNDVDPPTLTDALTSILRGRRTARALLPVDERVAWLSTHEVLSRREVDVLRLLAEGRRTDEVASDLCFSERTVKNIVNGILMKTGCTNRVHAVATALRASVI